MAAKKSTTGVICSQCKTPIPIERVDKLAEEFSVHCPKCGQRRFYEIKDLKTLDIT